MGMGILHRHNMSLWKILLLSLDFVFVTSKKKDGWTGLNMRWILTKSGRKGNNNFNWTKIFFAHKNLKCLKICSQNPLCSPRQISGRYFSKKKLVIFQEICDPGYAKKVKKLPILKKKFFRSKQPKTP